MPERRSSRMETVDFSVQPLLEHVDEVFGSPASDKGLRWGVMPSLARVHSHPALLERMLSQLVDKAIRFTPRGGVVVSGRARGANLLLQVWDTGLGMRAQRHEPVFKASLGGHQFDTVHTPGLDLAVVISGARALGIGFAQRFVPGQGACCSLSVPLARAVCPSLKAPLLSTAVGSACHRGPWCDVTEGSTNTADSG